VLVGLVQQLVEVNVILHQEITQPLEEEEDMDILEIPVIRIIPLFIQVLVIRHRALSQQLVVVN
jgi:hypothetical protein